MKRERIRCPYCGRMVYVGGFYAKHVTACSQKKMEQLIRTAKRYGYLFNTYITCNHRILWKAGEPPLEIELRAN